MDRTESYQLIVMQDTNEIATFDGGYGDEIVNVLESLEGIGGDAAMDYETTPKLLGTGSYIVSARAPEKTVTFTAVMPNSDGSKYTLDTIRGLIENGSQVQLVLKTFVGAVLEGQKTYEAFLTSTTTPQVISRQYNRVTITALIPSGKDTGGQA